ncbi:hypothetical protein ACIA8K_17055 [Catenuloplanes sp. NPDC051500]|uniref:hypothetical protein n=1 Tax=Catenuloplanes sp. NPDC051500 TaxID=3363959 RepID=UPI00378CAA38
MTSHALRGTARTDRVPKGFPRFIRRPGNGRDGQQQPATPLTAPVSDYVSQVGTGQERAFRCLTITAPRGDGLSRAAAQVAETVAGHPTRPRFRLVTVAGRPSDGGVPQIFGLLSRRAVARAARYAGVPGTRWTTRLVRPGTTVLVLLAAVGMTALISLLAPPGGAEQPLATAIILAVLGVTAQVLVGLIRPGGRIPLQQRVTTWLEGRAGDDYKRFIGALAVELADIVVPRCLVVDDFGLLDRVTRDLLIRYLRDGHSGDNRPELWVVFDPADSEFDKSVASMERDARLNRQARPYGVRRIVAYELLPLTPEERASLADLAGRPERAGYRTVKAILSESDDTLVEYFREQLPAGQETADPGRYAAFQLLYLLSLASARGSSVELPEQQLLRKLAESRQRSHVLRVMLGGRTPSRTELSRRLDLMRRDYARVITEVRRGPDLLLSVSGETGRTLERQSGAFGLPEAELGHLFWALYRDDNHATTIDDAFWLGRMVDHLLRAASPRDHESLFKDQTEALADRLFQAIVHAVDDCLRLGRLRQTPQLLRRAADLLTEDDRRARALLLPRARDVYAVLADSTVLRLLPELVHGAGVPWNDAPLPLRLFVAATSADTPERVWLPALRPGGALASLRTDAQLRGSWLALSLWPFTGAGTPQLLASERSALAETPAVTHEIITDCGRQPRGRPVADLIQVSIGLWTWALAGARGRFTDPEAGQVLDALETVFLLAAETRDHRVAGDPAGGTVDLVREGLAEELFTVTAAGAVVVRLRWPDLEPETAEAIDGVIEDTFDALGIRVSRRPDGALSLRGVAGSLLARMSLLQMTWRVMGYDDLATHLSIRRVQLNTLLPSVTERGDTADGAERALVEDRDRGDLLGLLANLATAERASVSGEETAEVLVRAITGVQRGGEAHEELLAELSMLALTHASGYRTSTDHQVAYLLEPSAGTAGTRLDRLLSTVDDAWMPDLAVRLANVAGEDDATGVVVEDILARREEAATDDDVRRRLREQLWVLALRRTRAADRDIAIDDILDRWAGNRSSPSYAYVLFLLVPADPAVSLPERLHDEVTDVLDRYEDYLQNTGVVLLAADIARRYPHRRAAPPEYDPARLRIVLREGRRDLEHLLPVHVNIEVLRFLSRYDRGVDHRADLAYWDERQLRLIEERKLGDLLTAGRYALLLLTYLTILIGYGLQVRTVDGSDVVEDTDPDRLRHADTEPLPVVAGSTVLSAQWEFDAEVLFGTAECGGAEFDDARRDFDSAARDALPRLFGLVSELPDLPDPIRAILRRHRTLVRDRLAGPALTDPSMRPGA